MSNQTQAERASESTDTSGVYAFLRRRYYIPAIVAVVAFMFYVRIQNYNAFYGDGEISLQAVDSWYHWRTTEWTVENYPGLIGVDPWTSFPEGHLSGQFGTLFDFIVATVAMIIGLGDPSQNQILLAALITVPAMAALVAIPTFYIGRRLGGTIGGLAGIAILALAPGTFLARTTAGQFQHHVAEVLFMSLAVLAMMVAVRAAEEDQPIYELIKAKEWEELRRPTLYSALAGFATLLYILSWPPGVVLIGIFGVFFVIQLSIDFVKGRSPDHLAYVGVVSMLVVSVGTALFIQEPGFSATGFDYFQPTFPLLVAGGCVFMAILARQWQSFDLDNRGYPVAIAGSIVVAVGLLALVLPDIYSTLMSNLTGRILPFGHSASALTVQEVQPPSDPADHMFAEFGFAFFTALIGIVLLIIQPVFGRERRAEHVLVVVWSLFLISMALSQVRFSYYLIVGVAVLNAYLVHVILQLISFPDHVSSLRSIETHHAIVVVLVLMMLFAPLLPPIAGASAIGAGGSTGPHPDSVTWEESNEWLQENTPEPGNWGDAENADRLDYHGYYEYNDEGVFEYPEGSYGVLSWWDYGHLINVQGERMAHSNPFQSYADSSSAFLTAQSEDRAKLLLDAIAVGEEPTDESNEALEQMIADGGDGDEEIRYVMIDDQMAGGKFSAITAWTGPDYDSYYDFNEYEFDGEQQEIAGPNQNFYDTTTASLYLDDASGMENYRLVHENDDYAFVGGMQVGDRGGPHYSLPISEYNQFIQGASLETTWGDQAQTLDSQLADARENNEVYRSPLLNLPMWDAQLASTVKTFERVEGATITGTADDVDDIENATVTAAVELEADPGRTFIYEQEAELDDDGEFELTVPYATNDELGVEDGYTDSSVEALTDYIIEVEAPGEQGLGVIEYQGETEVSETDIVEGGTVQVDLESVEIEDPNEDANTDNETDDEEADENGEAEDGDTDGAETDETDGEESAEDNGNETAAMIEPVAVDVAG